MANTVLQTYVFDTYKNKIDRYIKKINYETSKSCPTDLRVKMW